MQKCVRRIHRVYFMKQGIYMMLGDEIVRGIYRLMVRFYASLDLV